METLATILIIIHASFGGLALISGTVSMTAQKGGKNHRKSGKLFFYTMLLCCLSALTVAVLPNHESPFLFSVGIFSLYFLLTGNRALNWKKEVKGIWLDRLMAISMFITALLMLFYLPITIGKINIILSVFGAAGGLFAVQDMLLFRKPEKMKKRWLVQHLSRMLGAYIAAFTAFIVVNKVLPSYVAWLLPGFLGGFYIAYWTRKVQGKKKKA